MPGMRAMAAGAVAPGLLLAACGGGGGSAQGAASGAAASAATGTASGHFRYRGTGSATAGGFRGGGFIHMGAAAGYLGISTSQLRRDLRAGKSLANVARAQGKTVQGLEQAWVAAAKKQLARAVSAGRMTAAQEQQQLASLQQRTSQLVTRTFPATATASGSGG